MEFVNFPAENAFANKKLEPTYLVAGVEVVAIYQFFNINRTKLKNIIHRVFVPAKLDIEIKERCGNPWCLSSSWTRRSSA